MQNQGRGLPLLELLKAWCQHPLMLAPKKAVSPKELQCFAFENLEPLLAAHIVTGRKIKSESASGWGSKIQEEYTCYLLIQ